MVNDVQLKICGLTNQGDAEAAERLGADYLGFILYPQSPRFVALERAREIAGKVAGARTVAVTVEPTAADLAKMKAAGFDFFQVHFRMDLATSTLTGWGETVGVDRLWLAPKLPPGMDVAPAIQALANTFLLDTFDAEKFGGTGRTGDWGKFARHQRAYRTKTWILSGGLNPGNVGEALRSSGARFIDVNSGVESAPGVKDPAKLKALVEAMK